MHNPLLKSFVLQVVSLSLLLTIPSVQAQAPPVGPAPVELDSLGRATEPLGGVWQFHLGDNLVWVSPTLDDSAWQPMQAGHSWESQGHPGYTGFAWYRRHLVFAPGQAPNWRLALLITNMEDACEVYWNGVLVGSYGRVPPHPVWYFEQPLAVFPLGPPRSGVLAIRVWKAPHAFLSSPGEGGLVSVPTVGSAEAIANLQTAARYRWLRGNQIRFALALLCAIVGVFALIAWLRNRHRMMLVWLALCMLNPAIGTLLFWTPGLLPFRVAYGLIGPLVSINDAALWFLLLALLGLNNRPRLVRWTTILAVASVCFDLLDGSLQLFDWSQGPARWFLLGDVAATIPPVLLELWGLVLVLSAFRKRLDAARWMLAIAVLLADLTQAVDDITGLGTRWTGWTIQQKLSAPLFTIAGNPLNHRAIANLLLLTSILYAAWRYSVEQSQRQNTLEQEYRNAQELQQVLVPVAL